MTTTQNIESLRNIIDHEIRSLIPGNYILLDAPYYHNIGDVLIWEGVKDFCKTLPGKNLGTSNITTCLFPKIKKDTTILLMGGGNFGDLWRVFQDFRLEVIRRYPENRIVMFPQSVCYEQDSLIQKDASIINSHKDLHLCARDEWSYTFMRKHFGKCNIHLVPDMAFYIDSKTLSSKVAMSNRLLYLKRMDKEFVSDTSIAMDNNIYDVHDWPTYEQENRKLKSLHPFVALAYRTKKIPVINRMTASFADHLAQKRVRENLVKIGVDFLSQYSGIVTTRLHTMILGLLLNLPVKYIDNTSGKLSAFADTWLKDCDLVKPYQRK